MSKSSINQSVHTWTAVTGISAHHAICFVERHKLLNASKSSSSDPAQQPLPLHMMTRLLTRQQLNITTIPILQQRITRQPPRRSSNTLLPPPTRRRQIRVRLRLPGSRNNLEARPALIPTTTTSPSRPAQDELRARQPAGRRLCARRRSGGHEPVQVCVAGGAHDGGEGGAVRGGRGVDGEQPRRGEHAREEDGAAVGYVEVARLVVVLVLGGVHCHGREGLGRDGLVLAGVEWMVSDGGLEMDEGGGGHCATHRKYASLKRLSVALENMSSRASAMDMFAMVSGSDVPETVCRTCSSLVSLRTVFRTRVLKAVTTP